MHVLVWAELICDQAVIGNNTANLNGAQRSKFELPRTSDRSSRLVQRDKTHKPLVVEFEFSKPPSRDVNYTGRKRKCISFEISFLVEQGLQVA